MTQICYGYADLPNGLVGFGYRRFVTPPIRDSALNAGKIGQPV